MKKHDPTGSAKLREFRYTVWVANHTHDDDSEIEEGIVRPPDRVLELSGLRLQVAQRAGRVALVDEVSGCPVPIIEFIERARQERRRIYGILVATVEEE